MDTESVIVAVASPPGRSMRGIVRLSGPRAFDAFNAAVNEDIQSPLAVSRTLQLIRLVLTPPHRAVPALALTFPGPRSYTGEDTVELQLPGNPILLDRVVDAIIDAGRSAAIDVRRADPGEFTARAYFCGRLSLTEAEGVAATIAAQNDAALRAANVLTSGRLGSFAHELADELAGALALVEAGIDFTDEEDVVAITPADLHARIDAMRARLNNQLAHSVGLESLSDAPWVVLAGPPNAGKSTLFNALLGRDRAVVSDVAGTTRDVIAEPLTIDTVRGGAEVMLVDLAGLDDADASQMNVAMQSAARSALARAELVLYCAPATVDQRRPGGAVADVPTLDVRTMCDLVSDRPGEQAASTESAAPIRVSAVSGRGIDALREAIARQLADRAVSLAADALALNPRHESAMRDAMIALDEAKALTATQISRRALDDAEVIAAAMRAALDALAELAGDITPDDVLGRIFSTFCIGK